MKSIPSFDNLQAPVGSPFPPPEVDVKVTLTGGSRGIVLGNLTIPFQHVTLVEREEDGVVRVSITYNDNNGVTRNSLFLGGENATNFCKAYERWLAGK